MRAFLCVVLVGCVVACVHVGSVRAPHAAGEPLPALAGGRPFAAWPSPDGARVFFLRTGPHDRVAALYAFDVATGQTALVASPEGDATIGAAERAERERRRAGGAGYTSFELSRDGSKLLLPYGGRVTVLELATGAQILIADGAFDARFSPDGTKVGFVKADALWVCPSTGGTPVQLSPTGAGDVVYAQAEFVAAEEMDRFDGWWWAPDSHAVAYERYDASKVEHLEIDDPANAVPTTPVPYPRPGHPNVDAELFVQPLDRGALPRRVVWDHARAPYLVDVVWAAGGLTLVVESRDQKELLLLATKPADTLMADDAGPALLMTTRELAREYDDVFVDSARIYRWLDDGSGFLWSSQKDAGLEIQLRKPDGTIDHVVAPASLGVRKIIRVNPRAPELDAAVGAESVDQQIVRVPLAGGAPVPLTPAGRWSDATFGDAGTYAVRVAREDAEPAIEIHRADGTLAGELPSVAEPAIKPTVTIRKAGAYWTATIRPRAFDAHRKYPVIDDVYGGPGILHVARDRAGYAIDQWLADRGYVVVRIEGRGTPDRGRAWSRAIAGALADVPLDDQVKGLAALAAIEPSMDLARVGVTGGSFGGFLAALAVLRRPDVFRAAVAISPVTDWLDYDTFYTERYLGVPDLSNPKLYAANSLILDAPRLTRPLLLVHGTADDNVLFRHSLELADALVRAGKAFELVPLVGQTHNVSRDPILRDRLYERVATFFDYNL